MIRKLLALAVLLTFATASHAIVNGAVPADSDTRFDAVGALAVTWRLGLAENASDPAAGPHNWYCNATLTAPDEVRTERHCVDAALGGYGAYQPHAVRFRRRVDGGVGSIDAGVESFFHAYVASWEFTADELAVGHLAAPVAHIAPMSVLYDDATVATAGATIIVAGWGREAAPPNDGQVRRLLYCDTVLSSVQPTYLLFASAWSSKEVCGPGRNDSGGAALIYHATQSEPLRLHLIGTVHSFDYTYARATHFAGYAQGVRGSGSTARAARIR